MKRRTSTIVVAIFAVFSDDIIIIQTNALRLSSASSAPAEKKRSPPRQKHPLFRTSLKSLARAARDGSSTWGDHITSPGRVPSKNKIRAKHQSTSMKQSSSIFISKLHKKIQSEQQQQQQQNPKETQMRPKRLNKNQHYASVEEMIELNSYEYPEEHFVQEILAVVVSGAAATSAFAAVTTSAFIATLAVAVGSVVTVLFLDDTEDAELTDATFIETTEKNDANDQEEIREEDCDITGKIDIVDINNKIVQQHEEPIATKKLTNFTMLELRRCYNGKTKSPLQFSQPYRNDMCVVYTESDKSTTFEGEVADHSDSTVPVDDMVNALEKACVAGDCETIVPSVERIESNKRVNVVWHDPRVADGFKHLSDKVKPKGKDHGNRFRQNSRSGRSNSQHDNDYADNLTDAEKEGALLLSQSFRVAASAFGVVADAVRFTGETAAVCTGGTARLAGGVFRLSGWAVNQLGSAIEQGGAKKDRISQAEEPASGKPRTSKRKVAGESVRLLGESIEQVADSLLLAGSATERVAFAAASVAEGAVRFFGDIALSASDMFARESQNSLTSGLTPNERGRTLESDVQKDDRHSDQLFTPTLNKTAKMFEGSSLIESQMNEEYHGESDFFGWALNNVDDIMADTLGVGSLAPELLGVFVACYLGSLLLLRRNAGRPGEVEKPPQKPSHISIPKEHSHAPHATITHDTLNDTDSHTTLTDWTTKHATGKSRFTFLKRITSNAFFVVLLPMKLFSLVVGWVWFLAFNRKSILLVLYSMGFLFLSRSSQYKATVIKRKSLLLGYHDAIASIGQSSMSYVESSMWLNMILNHVWRVNDDKPSSTFGGLEPYLSSFASASLVESLSGSYNKPSGVAHVSFNSFTFGKKPPMIRGIEISRVDGDASVVYMTIDVGILMEAELLLDVSPSSLDYKMVPTTTLSINSLDAELQLDVSVKSISHYPYISNVNVSLSHEIQDFSLRIEPRSQSGKAGVNFGSFPVISKWIKESIFESLREYVTPKYVSVDIPAWLNGDQQIVSYI